MLLIIQLSLSSILLKAISSSQKFRGSKVWKLIIQVQVNTLRMLEHQNWTMMWKNIHFKRENNLNKKYIILWRNLKLKNISHPNPPYPAEPWVLKNNLLINHLKKIKFLGHRWHKNQKGRTITHLHNKMLLIAKVLHGENKKENQLLTQRKTQQKKT